MWGIFKNTFLKIPVHPDSILKFRPYAGCQPMSSARRIKRWRSKNKGTLANQREIRTGKEEIAPDRCEMKHEMLF